MWGRYCACEILIANPIDWLFSACLEYIYFFLDRQFRSKKTIWWILSVNHANNNLCTWQNAFSMHYIHKSLIHHLFIGGWFKRMELIEVKKFNLGAKGETLYNLWKCDVNFRDPQIQIHSSTSLHFHTYYTYAYPLFQMIVMLF